MGGVAGVHVRLRAIRFGDQEVNCEGDVLDVLRYSREPSCEII